MEDKIFIQYVGVSPLMIEKLNAQEEIDFIVHSNMQAAEIYLKSSRKPDAILSDLQLSGGDGFKFYEKLREKQEFQEVAFILLSDEFQKDVYDEAMSKNIDDFYVLPDPSVEQLVSRVRFLKDYRHKYPVEPPTFVQDVVFKMPLSKRVFDLVVAISALLLLSPLLLVVIAAIWIESKGKGKVYYTSKRFGRSEIFDFYKLRSMRIGSDKEIDKLSKEKNQYTGGKKQEEIDFTNPCEICEGLPEGKRCSTLLYIHGHEICENEYKRQVKAITKSAFVKVSNDPRVTRVGRFIRKTSIDELPQLINVIKGDMSIVGNRPLPIYEVEHLLKDRNTRAIAPAGITGLWQVELRGRRGVMSESQRKSFDDEYTNQFEELKHLNSEYAEHFSGGKWSFWYDLKLIFRTAMVLFQKDSV